MQRAPRLGLHHHLGLLASGVIAFACAGPPAGPLDSAPPTAPPDATPPDAATPMPDAGGPPPDGGRDGGPAVCGCVDGGTLTCPVQALQDRSHRCFAGARSGIVIENVVVTTPVAGRLFWVGEPAGGPFSGVAVLAGAGVALPYLLPGDVVTVEGATSEFYGRTQLTASSITVNGQAGLPPFTAISAAQVCATCSTAEPYEGVLVSVSDLRVLNPDVGFGEFNVQPVDGGAVVRVDDLFAGEYPYRPATGDEYSELRGVLDYTFSAYKIEPRQCSDFLDAQGAPWCPAPDCPTTPVDIPRIHDVTRADAVPLGCLVRVNEAVVTTPVYVQADGTPFAWIQQGVAQHGGMWVVAPGVMPTEPVMEGTRVSGVGEVAGNRISRGIILRSMEVLGQGQPPAPVVLGAAVASGHVAGAAGWEGMLVKVDDVVTVDPRPYLEFGVDLGLFEIVDRASPAEPTLVGNGLVPGFACPWPRLNEPCTTDQRAAGQRFASITGIISGEIPYVLLPRTAADLVLAGCDSADPDCDGIAQDVDLCPALADPLQADDDTDGVGNACDVCPGVNQAMSQDTDGDGVGDACDACPSAVDPGQEDLDGDDTGNACDADVDGDGQVTPDNCPWAQNPGQEDTDGDGIGDACEGRRWPVALDGRLEDWAGLAPMHVDPSGDPGPGGVDFRGLWMADDGLRLYLRVELGREITIQQNNALRLYVDADNNAATGLAVHGIGAELEWRPGVRQGLVHAGGASTPVRWADVGFIALPTVSSDVFELALSLDATPVGTTPLFGVGTVRVALGDGDDGDVLPDAPGGVAYQPGGGDPVVAPPVNLARAMAQDLRVMTWNVLDDGPWRTGNGERFARVLAATNPDVILVQEVSHPPAEVATLVASALPGTWHAAGARTNVVLSRHAVVHAEPIGEGRDILVVLDTPAQLGTQFAVVNLHLPCCDAVIARRHAVDSVLEAIRNARGTGTIATNAPLVVAGDFNLVDVADTRDALARGDVRIETVRGPDFHPDPAGRPLETLVSHHAGSRLGYTQVSAQEFGPSQLDYVMYTSSRLEVGNHFVLNTADLSDTDLAGTGLQRGDSSLSDHLARIADFRAPP